MFARNFSQGRSNIGGRRGMTLPLIGCSWRVCTVITFSEVGRKDRFRVVLMEEGREPELVFETASPRQATIWAGEWLKEHLGIPVGIVPPSHLRYQTDTTPP